MIKISVNLENIIKISGNIEENKGATRLGDIQGKYSPVRESPQSRPGCRRSCYRPRWLRQPRAGRRLIGGSTRVLAFGAHIHLFFKCYLEVALQR